MNLKNLFSRKSRDVEAPSRMHDAAPNSRLDLDALDACVGGRAESNGVGCYVRSSPPPAH